MARGDLHSALKTSVEIEVSASGMDFKHVRLQNGKDDFEDTVHVYPNSWSSAGIQTTDFLKFLGFSRSSCAFGHGECYCRKLSGEFDFVQLVNAIATGYEKFKDGAWVLANCGINVDQPEGFGYFHGRPSSHERYRASRASGDGHTSPKSQRMKETEDEHFRFVFSWIEGGADKGWTTHIRPKHMPITEEFEAALAFLGGFGWFPDCPEFDFEGCWWRFTPFKSRDRGAINSSAEMAQEWFRAFATHFSPGIQKLLEAHASVAPYGISFLRPQPASTSRPASVRPVSSRPSSRDRRTEAPLPDEFDVALTFAGTERDLAEDLATRVRDAGFRVFYDGFYPEQLWGKDLASFFDRVYRKGSRFCVMFVSKEYAERMWTTHERRSAQARAIEERGCEYILPIRIDDTDLDGLVPTIGYLSASEYDAEGLAELLIRKLRQAT